MTLEIQEVAVMDEFRKITSDLNLDESILLRFLRARDLDVKRAEEMLRKSIAWRESNDIDSVRDKWTIPSEIKKDFRVYYTGVDDNNHPVFIMNLGRWDGRKILGKGLKEETVRFMHRTLELVMAKCKEFNVTKFTIIIDNDGLSMWKCVHFDSIESTIRVIKDFEANYPETLLNCFLINTPTVFWQAFKFVKPILAGNTLEKIQIFDSDKAKWQSALLEKIPASSLPKDFGGLKNFAEDLHL